jgi:presequence protease
MTMKHGFELLREEYIAEINSTAQVYRHGKSGAELLSLINDDENKVFGITFRTPSTNSTGIAHIMEHSVLCGSRKYPVKEPFVELDKGSLKTFLNAFTYPDKTCYPVASQNLQDFYNLVDVYLDAVFYPLIGPYTLKQEGWHYELDSLDGELTYKGVVFNEMKGAYSSPDGVLAEAVQHALLPDTPYGIDSGGDPVHIPELTHEQFKDFHTRFYHPSNARIYFYGNDDPQQRLAILDAYLRDFDRIPVPSQIALQARFDAPRVSTKHYEVSESDEAPKSMLTTAWLLPEPGDVELTLGFEVLNHILIGTSASPLRKVLIDSGLGEDLTGQGMETGARQMFYSVGMKGVQQENLDAVDTLIQDTLTRLAEEGIDPDTVAASLNTVEFILRERNTGRFPRGLAIMLRSLDIWLYDGDPLALLRLEEPLENIKRRLAQGEKYFEELIRRYWLDNRHRVTVRLEPDAELAHRRAAEEKARLEKARAGMTQADLQTVMAEAEELKRRQDTPDSPEALATIPSLQLSDIDRQVRTIPAEEFAAGPSRILYHDLFTNGILYFDLGFNLHTLPAEYLPYMPLFGRALTEMGTRRSSFVQFMQRIGTYTGGIRPQTMTSAALGKKEAAAWFFLRGKAMVPQTADLLDLLGEALLQARLEDRERFRQMVLEEKSSLESGLVQMGSRIVNLRLKSHFDEASWAVEQYYGISQLFFLRKLIDEIDQNWPLVQQRLEDMRGILFCQDNAIVNVTLDEVHWKAVRPQVQGFLSTLPGGQSEMMRWDFTSAIVAEGEGLTIPAQVNFVGKAGSLLDAGYGINGSILAILQFLNATWMWEKVRVQGGAYGGFAAFELYSGVFSFLSYRDPNLLATLETYDKTVEFLRGLEIPEEELTKSIIGAIGELDAYLLPDAKGFTSLTRRLIGIDDTWRQQFRDQLLATSPKDFHRLADALEAVREKGLVAVLGSEASIQSANAERQGMFKVMKVL